MSPQYVAVETMARPRTESFLTQRADIRLPVSVPSYVSPERSDNIALGHTQVTDTSYQRQVASTGRGMSGTSNRRNRCRRASRACWFFAPLSLWQHAESRKKKNSSWLIPRPCLPSRPTPANSSNTGSGPAFGGMPPGLVPSNLGANRARAARLAMRSQGGRIRSC